MATWNTLDTSAQDSLSDHVDEMTAFCAASQSTIHVLLDRGDADVLPAASTRLLAVPDRYFAQEPWLGPHLLTLSGPEDVSLLREALATAVIRAIDPMRPQCVGAVLLGPAQPDALVDHFIALALQHDPEGESRVFRYQDPRVMQRVWPTLAEAQRRFWLGPVRRWIGAVQPIGPLGDDHPVDASLWQVLPDGPDDRPFTQPHHLLDARQWRLAHSGPAEVAFWRLARESALTASPSRTYPEIGVLRRWLNDAADHRLDSNDQCEWALCCWAAGADVWESPSGQQRVRDALGLQRRHAGLRFGDAWRTAGARL
jgi:hypothetical protein